MWSVSVAGLRLAFLGRKNFVAIDGDVRRDMFCYGHCDYFNSCVYRISIRCGPGLILYILDFPIQGEGRAYGAFLNLQWVRDAYPFQRFQGA
jgi:hypothetical protein